MTTENVFAIWKQIFPVLRMGFRTKLVYTRLFIHALACLHNLGRVLNDPLPSDEQLEPTANERRINDHQADQVVAPANNEAGARIQGKLRRDAIFHEVFDLPH